MKCVYMVESEVDADNFKLLIHSFISILLAG